MRKTIIREWWFWVIVILFLMLLFFFLIGVAKKNSRAETIKNAYTYDITQQKQDLDNSDVEASSASTINSKDKINPKIVTLFDDPAVWDGANKVVTDEQILVGNKSLKVTSTDERITEVIVPISNLDLLNGYLNFDVCGVDTANLQYLRVFIFANDGGYISNTWYSNDFIDNKWERLYLGIGGRRVDYANLSGDLTSLTNVESVRFDIKSKTGTSITFYLDKLLSFQNRLEKAFATINFDDGFATDFTVAKSIMDKYNFKGVSFVPYSAVETSRHLSLAQVHSLYDAGWDIGSHTRDHEDLAEKLSEAEILTQIKDEYDWLISEGFNRSAKFISYPHGIITDTALNIVKEYHTLARGGNPAGGNPRDFQHLPVSDKMRIAGVDAGVLNVDEIKTLIDTAIKSKRWINLYFHEIKDVSAFEEVMQYIYSNGISVYTYSDIETRIIEP